MRERSSGKKLMVMYQRQAEESGETFDASEQLNMLAKMFRAVEKSSHVKPDGRKKLMDYYTKNPKSGIKQVFRARSSEQSNLNRALTKPGMTVMVFTRGLRVYNPDTVEFILALKFFDKTTGEYTTTEHVVTYDNDDLFTPYSNSKNPGRKNFLAQFWDDIQRVHPYTTDEWRAAVSRYLESPYNDLKSRGVTRSSERSNLNRGLSYPNMSIRTFTKALRVMEVVSVEFTANLHFGASVYRPTIIMDTGQLRFSPFDDEEHEDE